LAEILVDGLGPQSGQKSQIPLRYLVRSWFEAGSKLVADMFEAGSNLSATSFEPDSVMEFGLN